MNKCILMIQTSNHRWQIRTPKGILIVDDIHVNSAYEAEEYVKRYVSSYNDWTYEVQPILKSGGSNVRW